MSRVRFCMRTSRGGCTLSSQQRIQQASMGTLSGTLEKALNGTRDAPQAWQDELSRTLAEIGLTTSARSPRLCWDSGAAFVCNSPSTFAIKPFALTNAPRTPQSNGSGNARRNVSKRCTFLLLGPDSQMLTSISINVCGWETDMFPGRTKTCA